MEKKTHSQNTMDYIHNYDKQTYKQYLIKIRRDEHKIIEKLESVKSKNEYIIGLIRSDLD